MSLGAAAGASESPFGSKVRKGMFRTVGQLYKVCCLIDVISSVYVKKWELLWEARVAQAVSTLCVLPPKPSLVWYLM